MVAGGSVWAEAKDGQWKQFQGIFSGIFCCQSLGNSGLRIVFHIVYQATGLFRFPRVPLPHQPGPGLMVTCSFKNSSREENDCQLHCAAGPLPQVQPGPHSTGLRTALPRRRRRGPGPLTGVQSRAGEADRRARAAVAPAAGPRCSRAATLGGEARRVWAARSRFRFSRRTPPSFGRAGLHTGPHRSARPRYRLKPAPPPGVRAWASRALQPPPQLLGLSPAPVQGRVLREMGRH